MKLISKLIVVLCVLVVTPASAAHLPDFKSLVKEASPAVC